MNQKSGATINGRSSGNKAMGTASKGYVRGLAIIPVKLINKNGAGLLGLASAKGHAREEHCFGDQKVRSRKGWI